MLIDRNPEDDRYWNLKGNVYYYFGNDAGIFVDRQYEESLKCYNIAIKLNSNDKILKNNKANLYLIMPIFNTLKVNMCLQSIKWTRHYYLIKIILIIPLLLGHGTLKVFVIMLWES